MKHNGKISYRLKDVLTIKVSKVFVKIKEYKRTGDDNENIHCDCDA